MSRATPTNSLLTITAPPAARGGRASADPVFEAELENAASAPPSPPARNDPPADEAPRDAAETADGGSPLETESSSSDADSDAANSEAVSSEATESESDDVATGDALVTANADPAIATEEVLVAFAPILDEHAAAQVAVTETAPFGVTGGLGEQPDGAALAAQPGDGSLGENPGEGSDANESAPQSLPDTPVDAPTIDTEGVPGSSGSSNTTTASRQNDDATPSAQQGLADVTARDATGVASPKPSGDPGGEASGSTPRSGELAGETVEAAATSSEASAAAPTTDGAATIASNSSSANAASNSTSAVASLAPTSGADNLIADPTQATPEPAQPPAIDPARFVSRVARAFDFAQQRGGGPIEIRLSPPELGTVQLKIELSEGVLTASLETETQAARNALLDNLPALRERLAEQEIRVEKFDVDVRDEGRQPELPDQRDASAEDDRQDRRDPGANTNDARRGDAPNAADPTADTADGAATPQTIRFDNHQINLVA
ncbi:MAG: flagellar hook-length control protein FliK [Planctomycetota bacterium]